MFTNNLVRAGGPPIGLNRMQPQDACGIHRHDNVELALVTGGRGEHRTADGSWRLQRGDVFVIPPGMAHGYGALRALCLVNVGYDPRRLSLPLARLAAIPGWRALSVVEPRLRSRQQFAGHLHLDDAALERALHLFSELERELASRASGWREAAEGWLELLLIHLARRYADHAVPAARDALRVDAVLAHIDAHLADRLTLPALARRAGVSTPTLTRLFRRLLGTSVIDHVIARRVAVAREQLTAGASVAEAAAAVGIRDAGYLARLCRQRCGTSPSALRHAST